MRFNYLLLFILFSFPAWGKIQVACLDCYSSASLMPAFLEKLEAEFGFKVDVEWILVKTHGYKPYHWSTIQGFPQGSRSLEYDLNKDGEAQRLADDLAAIGADFVVGGMDEGTFQACLVNHLMKTQRDNDVESRDIRNQKLLMSRAVGKKYGIPTEILTHDLDSALRFIDGFPQNGVVVKWNSGAGGVDMQFLSKSDRPSLIAALEARLTNRGTPFHGRPDEILIEPQIDFEREIYADTFTWKGETVITGLWEYYKVQIGEHKLYFLDRPLSLLGPEAKALRPIVSEINIRMKQTTGMAHIEMGLERGTSRWFLIENNVRVVGSGIPALEREIWGLSHLDLFLMSLFQPDRMEELMAKFRLGLAMRTDGAVFIMPSATEGFLTEKGISALQSLPTFLPTGPQYKMQTSDRMKRTSSLNTGKVIRLAGKTPDVQRDFERAFKMLRLGTLFEPDAGCAELVASRDSFYAPFLQRAHEIPWSWEADL